MRMLGAVTLLSLLLGGVVACSGSGGTDVAGGGTGGTGAVAVSYGTVTDLGSIEVNGLWWETEGAEISLDGGLPVTGEALPGGGDGLLRRGMVVRVEGSGEIVNGKRQAIRIGYDNILQGPVEGTPSQSQFTVFRQTIVVDPDLTRFEGIGDINGGGIGADDLLSGSMVEVSGYTAPDGTIQATYVEAKPGETELEIRGTILSTAVGSTRRFHIGTLTVDAESIGFDAAYEIGKRVQVKGTAYDPGTGILTAAGVEVEDGRIHTGDIDEAHLEGVVTSMGASWEAFILNGQPVNALEAEFNGGDPAAIEPGVRLEVEGMIRNGTLVAQEVSFADAIELAAPVAAVGVESLTLEGLHRTADGKPFEIAVRQGVTEYEGDQVLALDDIVVGDYVEVRARESGGMLLATKISSQGPAEAEPTITLQGPVDSSQIADPSITLLGVEIDTTNLLITDELEQPLTSQEFIAALRDNPNAVVEIAGTWAGGTASIAWQKIELDD